MSWLRHMSSLAPLAWNIVILLYFYRTFSPQEWSLREGGSDSSLVRDRGQPRGHEGGGGTGGADEFLHPLSPHQRPGQQARHKIVLLGPHDRFNFGDLLFEKVVHKLLVDRAGYAPENILVGGIVTTDMTNYGGASTILSMKVIQQLSRHAPYPFDIVYLGGEAMGCNHECGVEMLPTKQQQREAKADKACDCAYLFPKGLLVRSNYVGPTNMAIINSLGGSLSDVCREATATADYHSYRDSKDPELLFPDSAVMTRTLYGRYIEDITNFPILQEILRNEPHGYIAVQFKMASLESASDESNMARTLDQVSRESNHLPIVLFAAGTVPKHDSFDLYRRIAKGMNATTYILDQDPTVWGVVATVAHAQAVISTSLHVRIMAFQFQKSRATLCTKGKKHHRFIQLWERLSEQDACQTMETVSDALLRSQPVSDELLNEVVERYLVNFDRWTQLLQRDNRTIIHA